MAKPQGAPGAAGVDARDPVFITNEDSNRLVVVIDSRSNKVETTIYLTSFDEDLRLPWCFVNAGVVLTHAAMGLSRVVGDSGFSALSGTCGP